MPMVSINLSEWETSGPETEPGLRGYFLDSHPPVQAVAQTLTDSGILQVREVRHGLSLSASSYVGRIEVGQEVDITFDALPNTLLKGRVVYISPKASSEQGGVNYTTIIEFDEFDPRLRWGMTAYVNITVD